MTDDHSAVERAWKIHDATVQWTSNVDSKASFASAVQIATLGLIATLTGDGGALSEINDGWGLRLFWAGVGTITASLLVVLRAVKPRVRAGQIDSESSDNFVFFGHVRNWTPADLETALLERPILPVLSRQLVVMSQIAWRKHRELQVSISGFVVGAALVALASVVGR